MSIPWTEFISRLQESASNPGVVPDPIVDDDAAFEDALLKLSSSSALYGATFIRPTEAWNERSLIWTTSGPDDKLILAWISQALADGIFDVEPWFGGLRDESNSRIVEVFLQWANKDLQSCLTAFNSHFSPENRIPILKALLAIILSIPYSPDTPSSTTAMYALASHPLLDNIIKSLLLDTGNNLFPLGLRAMLSVIPYAPQIITPKVPLVMVILGRAVCWRDRPFLDAGQRSDTPSTYTPLPREVDWAVATSQMEAPVDPPISLQPVNIVRLWLVAIYGAWPSNLLAFVRDPVTYLRGKQVACPYQVEWDQVWPGGLLAARTGPLLREFSLHPSIMYFNSDGELRDAKRWDKIDPAEHVSRAHIIAHSERLSNGKADFFDEDDQGGLHSIENSETPTPTSPPHESTTTTDVQRLQRENMLLRLEVGYADRLRKQYLFHIGRIHKHSMRFSVDEAEVHSFANRMKEQKSQIEAVTNELSQHRRDASQAQQKHSKWQEQLRDKLSAFRNDKSNWQTEAASIRTDRNNLETTVLRQKAELAQVKNERFKLQNQLTEVAPKVRNIEDYEIRMKQLTSAQRLWDKDIQAGKDAAAEAFKWRARAHELERMVQAMHRAQRDQGPHRNDDDRLGHTKRCERCDHDPAKDDDSRQAHAGFVDATVNRPDLSYYQSVAERAQERADTLERENLELRTRLEGVGESQHSGGDRAFLWAE